MPTPTEEAQRLIAEARLNQGEIAAELSKALKRRVKSYTISRIVTGERQPKADELDALRAILDPKAAPALTVPRALKLTDSPELIPLFGTVAGPSPVLRLGEGNVVGVVPVHPAQKGAHEPFAFIVPDDRLADRLLRGEIGFALRNRWPQHGQMCLVEMTGGETFPYIYDRQDDQTLFLRVKKPKEEGRTLPLRDVAGIHVIVGATFSFA